MTDVAALLSGTAAHGEDFDDRFEGRPVHSGAVVSFRRCWPVTSATLLRCVIDSGVPGLNAGAARAAIRARNLTIPNRTNE